jgi:hypothetical protein
MLGHLDRLDPQHNQERGMKDVRGVCELGDICKNSSKQFAGPCLIGAHFGVLRDGLDLEPKCFFQSNGVWVIEERGCCRGVLKRPSIRCEHKIASSSFAARSLGASADVSLFAVDTEARVLKGTCENWMQTNLMERVDASD